jgi:hypothetical protein
MFGGTSMPEVKVKVEGDVKWLSGIVEDRQGNIITLELSHKEAVVNVASGGLAWLSLYFWGNPGDSVNVEILKGDKSLGKRFYKIDPDGSAARALQFDPDA